MDDQMLPIPSQSIVEDTILTLDRFEELRVSQISDVVAVKLGGDDLSSFGKYDSGKFKLPTVVRNALKKLSTGNVGILKVGRGYWTYSPHSLTEDRSYHSSIEGLQTNLVIDHQEEIELAGKELPPLPPIKGSVQYSKISFSFSKGQILNLANVSFEASSGSFIGVVGSSGSGKSTLLKMITRLFDPDEGQIRIDGHDISKVDLYSLRSQIGVVPQDSILFDGTIQENIALTRPESSFDEIRAAAKIACADGFIEDLPAGYSNRVGERGSALSGGQRQRLAIARMVLKHPKLLVLDEATSALDAETEELVTKNLAEEFKDRTVFFITHRLTSLRGADKILVMEKGVLVEEGTHSELLKLDGRYRSLYLKQGGES